MLMQNVVRLADRYFDTHNPDAIDRQERLLSCMALVAVFYMILSIAFAKLGELEKRHRVYHPDPNVSFELMIAPPSPKHVDVMPPPTSMDEGKADLGGKQAAAAQTQKVDIPVINANTKVKDDNKAVVTHQIPSDQSAPVNVASTNVIKHGLPQDSNAPGAVPKVIDASNSDETKGSQKTDGIGNDPEKTGPGGIGGGSGGTIGDGSEIGDAGGRKLPPVSLAVPHNAAQGDISPYRKVMLKDLALVWRPTKKEERILLTIRLAHDGTLIDVSVLEASSKKAAANAVKAVRETEFKPLPDWYKGEELTFKVALEGIQSQ